MSEPSIFVEKDYYEDGDDEADCRDKADRTSASYAKSECNGLSRQRGSGPCKAKGILPNVVWG